MEKETEKQKEAETETETETVTKTRAETTIGRVRKQNKKIQVFGSENFDFLSDVFDNFD